MRRTALSLDQQTLLIHHHNKHWEGTPSYISLQEGAKEINSVELFAFKEPCHQNNQEQSRNNGEEFGGDAITLPKKKAEVVVFEGSGFGGGAFKMVASPRCNPWRASAAN